MSLTRLPLPPSYNYIACFLTLECNLACDYCINVFDSQARTRRRTVSGAEWVEMLNRLEAPADTPVTLQGGEPSLHPDFNWIIKNLKKELNIDILTNLCFDIEKFIAEIDPARLRRQAPYPSIRVSFHPWYMDLDGLVKKVLRMQQAGFSIGIFGILHPAFSEEILKAQVCCKASGIDFRTKEFLGEHAGRLYGAYLYPEAVSGKVLKTCLCKTSELIIGPAGEVYRCHQDLYNECAPLGNLRDDGFRIEDVFRKCDRFGRCNPCDIKVKTNRFQIYGHTSVQIKDIR